MSTSGKLTTNTTYDSYFWVEWKLRDQNTIAERSIIDWSCGVYCGHSFYTNAIKMSAFTINGQQVYGGGTYSNFDKGDHTIASGGLAIYHDADGSKTFAISSFTGWLYSNYNYSSNGGSFELPRLAKKATITSASSFTDVENPSITFSNPGGVTMNVWLEPNPISDHLCVRENIPNTGSYTWVLTDAERNALRSKCAGKSCTIRLGLYSYVGGVEYADYRDMTYTMTENAATKPSVSMGVTLNNDLLPSKFAGLYIQGKSKVDVTLSATGKYNASIQSYSATMDGKTYNSRNFTSDVLQNSGSVKIVGYAKDSRGFTGSAEQTINAVAYSKPLVIPLGNENAIQCYRSDGNGKRVGNSTSVWIKAKISYHDVSGKNGCALQWRRKLATEEWSDSNHLWANLTSNEYNALIPGTVFELKKSYAIQIRAIDDIGEQDIKTFEIPTQDVALHLGEGGKNVAVGTYCDYSEDHTFYSEWKAIFDKEVVIGGSPVVDHIVERGTSAIWTYEKMASGIAKCWAKIDYTADLADVGVRSYVRIGKGFPVVFKSVPFCNCTLANQVNWNHILSSVDFTESMVVAISVYRLGAGVDVTAGGTADIMVIGYWK